MDLQEMKKYITRINKYRADYYKCYTGKEWTDVRNYDLSLNAGVLGFEKCVEEIIAYRKIRFDL